MRVSSVLLLSDSDWGVYRKKIAQSLLHLALSL
jgi:hypothetical protein